MRNWKLVQPDILFAAADKPLMVDKGGWHGGPDLIIEILSAGNRDLDRITKKALYGRFAVLDRRPGN